MAHRATVSFAELHVLTTVKEFVELDIGLSLALSWVQTLLCRAVVVVGKVGEVSVKAQNFLGNNKAKQIDKNHT